MVHRNVQKSSLTLCVNLYRLFGCTLVHRHTNTGTRILYIYAKRQFFNKLEICTVCTGRPTPRQAVLIPILCTTVQEQ